MIGILLINLGTPRSPSTKDVRKYLREFLSDPRVIDTNPLSRWLLVNFVIAPFRSPKSAEAYQKIWTSEGSPLLVNTMALGKAVSSRLGSNYVVEIGMRYGSPSIESALHKLIQAGVSEIRILPLYPQYAASSTGSTQEEVFRLEKKIKDLPPLRLLYPFFDHPGFIQSFVEIAQPLLEKFQPDHTLFSFHGLPERQILQTDLSQSHCLKSPDCCEELIPANGLCYRAHCFQTTRGIAKGLNLSQKDYTICFQSRLGRTPWIKPYTDFVLPELIQTGKKRIAVFCPSFVADCLETLEEIGIRAKKTAWHEGGELLLIPSLNAHPHWVEAVCQMVTGS